MYGGQVMRPQAVWLKPPTTRLLLRVRCTTMDLPSMGRSSTYRRGKTAVERPEHRVRPEVRSSQLVPLVN